MFSSDSYTIYVTSLCVILAPLIESDSVLCPSVFKLILHSVAMFSLSGWAFLETQFSLARVSCLLSDISTLSESWLTCMWPDILLSNNYLWLDMKNNLEV